MNARLNVTLFGGFVVGTAEGRVIEISGHKDRALLAYLAVSPGVPHYREKLASLLWGESGDKQARDSLKQSLLRLRRYLADCGLAPLIANRQSVMLDREAVAVDVGTFERLLRDGSASSLEQAMEVYHGDLLDGVQTRDVAFEDWLLVERRRLREMAVEAAAKLMAAALEDGRRDCAVAAARRLAALEPLHEAACRTLMQAHANRGERAQALRLFESLRDRLQRDLGVAPETETVKLCQSVRRQSAPEAALSAAPVAGPVNGVRDPAGHDGALQAVAAAHGEGDTASVAVLPFANIGGEPAQDYFADGLTEDIITDLSRISALSVAARHSVFAYKSQLTPLQEIAQQLGVKYLLEGSVRRAGERVRITAQLVDGCSGRQLWASRYDRRLENVFALQTEIAETIVDVLKVKLLPEERDCISSHSTKNVDAYQYYLIGRSFYLRGIYDHGLRIAREMFAKAIEIDPCYARAYAGIALCDSYLSLSDAKLTLQSSLANCSRALALDPNLAEAHAVEGLILYTAGRHRAATASFERAMALDPELFEAPFFHARNCRLQSLHEEAAVLFERAAALRPNDFRTLGLLAEEYRTLGRAEDFLAAAQRALQRIEAAIVAHPENADALAFGSAVLAMLGELEAAEVWAERALMIGPDDCLAHYNAARTYALLNKRARALAALERAFDGSPVLKRRMWAWMKRDQDIDSLRDAPRFRALERRLEKDPSTALLRIRQSPTPDRATGSAATLDLAPNSSGA